MPLPSSKFNMELAEWWYILYALDAKIEQLAACYQEPLRSQQCAPFLEVRKKIYLMVDEAQKKAN